MGERKSPPAALGQPWGLARSGGNLYISDGARFGSRLRRVDATGEITTVLMKYQIKSGLYTQDVKEIAERPSDPKRQEPQINTDRHR